MINEEKIPNHSVLIVDDNPENLRVLGNMLREHGYRIRVASGGEQALHSMETSPPDIVLLDIHMPGMDGYEVCRRVKANPDLEAIPVLFLSALGETFNKVTAYECGGADYITKPFQIEEVHVRMRAHLKTRRLLAESQAGFRSSFEQAAVGMAHLDLEGRFLRVNKCLCALLGYTEEDLLGSLVGDLKTAEGQEEVRVAGLRLLEGQEACLASEGEYRKKEGVYLWCKSTLSMVCVESTGERYLALIVEDISERKIAEKKLQESVARHRAFLMNLPVGACLCALDEAGSYLLVNPALAEMLGYESSEALLQSESGLCYAEAQEQASFLDLLREEERVEGFHLQLKKGDGSVFQAQIWGRLSTSGDAPCLEAVLIDVSIQQRAEEERRRLAAAIEQAAEAVIISDAEGAIQYINPAAERVSGYSREEVIGKSLATMKDGISTDGIIKEISHTLLNHDSWSGRFESKRKDGATYTQEATVSPVRDRSDKVVNYVVVARDITETLSLETRLRQAQKMEAIGTLAGGIAHDFNNILSAIIGYTDLAMGDLSDEQSARESMLEVAKAGERARDLVAQILAFSRQAEREIAPIRVQTVIKEAMRLLRGSIPSTIEIRQEIATDCSPVLADPTAIHQILMNLCTNAYQAMQEKGGALLVRLKQVEIGEEQVKQDADLEVGPYLRMEVHDSGHGMDLETQARIFEPYFTTKERGEGTGLGLATIHGIVQDLHGAIHVYSEPGEGTVFTLLLPCAKGADATLEGAGQVLPELAGSERVLLVDDEEPIGQFAERALGRLGYRVRVFNNSLEALDYFREHPDDFDVVVTDQMMPKMRGNDLSKEIQAIRPDIPVILCSGFGETFQGGRVDTSAVQDYVMKPIIGADLARSIRKVLGDSEATVEQNS